MKKGIKAAFCILFSFMFCFLVIGYAQLSDTLSIWGSAEVDINIPEGLFIIEMKEKGTPSNLGTNNYFFHEYTTTVDTSLKKASGSRTGTVTYEITVFNNTKKKYAYRDLYYQSPLNGYNGNTLITDQENRNNFSVITNFPNGETVEAGATLTFEVTYTIGRSMQNTTYKSLVNYQFGINVDSLEEARSAVLSKFENILNTTSTYETLFDKIDDKFSGAEWTSNYIGNVTDSSSTDSMTVNTLFAGHLQMVIDGVDNPITVLIKHENIDGNRQTGDDYTAVSGNQSFTGYGCEFTLYMTTSDLSNRNVRPPVYAAAFTCKRNADGSCGEWYMIGEPYEGTAQIVGYEGGESTGSFDTGTWRSVAETYSPVDNYSYNVEANQTIGTIVNVVDPNATALLETLLSEAKQILDDNIYAGSGMEVLESIYLAYNSADDVFHVASDGTITVDPAATRAQLIPHIQEITLALRAFEGVSLN